MELLEGPIYGPLTLREASLVERTYMGALLAREILASCDSMPDEFPCRAEKATHDESQNHTKADEIMWGKMNYWEMRRRDIAAGAKG